MDEPHLLLRLATDHFAGGTALWVGWILILAATRLQQRRWAARKVGFASAAGLLWIALSGWPSYGLQAALFAVVMSWLAFLARPSWNRIELRFRHCVRAVVVLALLTELPWTLGPMRRPPPVAQLAVIGDSVTAGLNDDDLTWPRVLSQTGTCEVWDASQQGATIASAAQQLHRLAGRGDALVIEIGGNDLLEGLPVQTFASQLDARLSTARRQYTKIVLLELPLPPFCNRYGIVQRRLARRYGISLIPKREFARVLTAAGSTVDGIHLSNRGQERMAEVVRYWLALPAQSATSIAYHRVDVR